MSRVSPVVKVLRYSDPDRLSLAQSAAIFLGKEDIDNVKRPINMLKNVPPHKSIYRGEHVRFEFVTSKVVYDHLITYTTADVRACAGLRANRAGAFVTPLEVVGTEDEAIIESVGLEHLKHYNELVDGIDPETQDPKKKTRLQAARAISPTSVNLHYIFQFNFLTLMEAIFPQRIWATGAQQDTAQVVEIMWELTRIYDPELWDMASYVFGTESVEWQQARLKMDRAKEPFTMYDVISDFMTVTDDQMRHHLQKTTLKEYVLRKFGKQKSMWDNK